MSDRFTTHAGSAGADVSTVPRAERAIVVPIHPAHGLQGLMDNNGLSATPEGRALASRIERQGAFMPGEAWMAPAQADRPRVIFAVTLGDGATPGHIEAATRNALVQANGAGIRHADFAVLDGLVLHSDGLGVFPQGNAVPAEEAARAMGRGMTGFVAAHPDSTLSAAVVQSRLDPRFSAAFEAEVGYLRTGASSARHGADATGSAEVRMTKADLTDDVRAQIAREAQRHLDAAPDTASRKFTVALTDGRKIEVTGISAADPVVTDGARFAVIQKRKDGPVLHAGGMKDRRADGRVETPVETALREAREEMGLRLRSETTRVEVMGQPQANPQDIRFYDPKYDPKGVLASSHGLKPGDAFIMDSVGVKITLTGVQLSEMEIAPKGQTLTPEQLKAWEAGRLLQAGDDAATVRIVDAADVTAGKVRVGLLAHEDMMVRALPDKFGVIDETSVTAKTAATDGPSGEPHTPIAGRVPAGTRQFVKGMAHPAIPLSVGLTAATAVAITEARKGGSLANIASAARDAGGEGLVAATPLLRGAAARTEGRPDEAAVRDAEDVAAAGILAASSTGIGTIPALKAAAVAVIASDVARSVQILRGKDVDPGLLAQAATVTARAVGSLAHEIGNELDERGAALEVIKAVGAAAQPSRLPASLRRVAESHMEEAALQRRYDELVARGPRGRSRQENLEMKKLQFDMGALHDRRMEDAHGFVVGFVAGREGATPTEAVAMARAVVASGGTDTRLAMTEADKREDKATKPDQATKTDDPTTRTAGVHHR